MIALYFFVALWCVVMLWKTDYLVEKNDNAAGQLFVWVFGSALVSVLITVPLYCVCVSYQIKLDDNNLFRLWVNRDSKNLVDTYLTPTSVVFKTANDVKFLDNLVWHEKYTINRITIAINGQSINKEGSPDSMLVQTTVMAHAGY